MDFDFDLDLELPASGTVSDGPKCTGVLLRDRVRPEGPGDTGNGERSGVDDPGAGIGAGGSSSVEVDAAVVIAAVSFRSVIGIAAGVSSREEVDAAFRSVTVELIRCEGSTDGG